MSVFPQEFREFRLEKDCKCQENDWDVHGMSSVRAVLMSAVPNMGRRRYNGSDLESEPWAAVATDGG